MISYYELLGMIKEDKAPNKIKVHLTSIPQVYVREDDLDDTFSYYGLEEEEKEDSDYHYYLAECFLESDMFEKNIEIIEEEKEIPEKLNLDTDELRGKETPRAIDYLIESKINQVIDYLKSKGE